MSKDNRAILSEVTNNFGFGSLMNTPLNNNVVGGAKRMRRDVEAGNTGLKKRCVNNNPSTPNRVKQEAKCMTPFTSPKTTLNAVSTPRTPRLTRAMLNQSVSATKPKRDQEALHLGGIEAFKIDANAFNSYLYTGKMTVYGGSNISREDSYSSKRMQTYYNNDDEETDNEIVNKGNLSLHRVFTSSRVNSHLMTPLPTFIAHNTTARKDITRQVDVLIKYPLIGSVDEWRDTYQTCLEEIDTYRMLETWKCPFLLRFYGTHGPGSVYEFVDGESLDSIIDVEGDEIYKQTWNWAELGLHTCTALKYLQEKGVSHNDLKPANVRYSAGKQIWKLLDLGLATSIDRKVGRGIGTDGYRAPEVAETGILHKCSDVYGFGVMMDDAFQSVRTRFRVLTNIANSYKKVLQMVEEEKNNHTSHDDGEIDIDTERVMIFQDFSKNFPGMSVEHATEYMDICLLWSKVLDDMQHIIDACLEEHPNDRPSIRRLIHVFRALQQREYTVQQCYTKLANYNIW